MATFSELVSAAVRAATHRVAEGSRRNARQALEVRYELARQGSEALATVPVHASARSASCRTCAAPAAQRRLTG